MRLKCCYRQERLYGKQVNMKFKDALNQAMDKARLNGKQLSELTGISEGCISTYRHGIIPPPEKLEKLKQVLDIDLDQNEEVKSRDILKESADKLGMSVRSLRICLQQDLIKPQIGIACKDKHSSQYTYTIFEERLDKFVKGEI